MRSRRVVGQVEVAPDGATLRVNVNGDYPTVIWPTGYTPKVGDAVDVEIIDSSAYVRGATMGGYAAITARVTGAAADGRVTVTTSDGRVMKARYVTPAPAVNTVVALLNESTEPVAVGAIASVPNEVTAPPVGVAPPPSQMSGREHYRALASGSWRPNGGRWEPGPVLQWRYSSDQYRGAWFYGGAAAQLAGRNVTRAFLRVASRMPNVGNFNNDLPLSLHVASGTGPGNWTPLTGNHDVTVPGVPSQPFWVELPGAWIPLLVQGNGIGVQRGSDYGGVKGIDLDPESGLLALDWTA